MRIKVNGECITGECNGSAQAQAIFDILNERVKQDDKWGRQSHPDIRGAGEHARQCFVGGQAEDRRRFCQRKFEEGVGTWQDIMSEEVWEAYTEAAYQNPTKLRQELIQIAAVAVAWIEDLDTRMETANADD